MTDAIAKQLQELREQFLNNLAKCPTLDQYLGKGLRQRAKKDNFLLNRRIRWITTNSTTATRLEKYLTAVAEPPTEVSNFKGIFGQLSGKGDELDFDERLEDAFAEVHCCEWLQKNNFTDIMKLKEKGTTPDFRARFNDHTVYAEAKNLRRREPDLGLIENLLQAYKLLVAHTTLSFSISVTQKFYDLRHLDELPKWNERRKMILCDFNPHTLAAMVKTAMETPLELCGGLYQIVAHEGLGEVGQSGTVKLGVLPEVRAVVPLIARILGTVSETARQLWTHDDSGHAEVQHLVFLNLHPDEEAWALDALTDEDFEWAPIFKGVYEIIRKVWPNFNLVILGLRKPFEYLSPELG